MIHKNFIELSRLMKEKGIEVGSGEWLTGGMSCWNIWDSEQRSSATDKNWQPQYPSPTIESILTVAFGEKMNAKCKEKNCVHRQIWNDITRTLILSLWDDEDNKPLHECPQLCSWLIGEIKNLK